MAHFLKKKRIARRTLLKGTGVALALPLLETMDHNPTRAQGTGKSRYALLFAGQSIGGDNYEQNNSRIDGERSTTPGSWVSPRTYGRGIDMTLPLEAMAGLEEDFSLVSNLKIPYSTSSDDPGSVPAGGAYPEFHGGAASPLLSGVRSSSASYRQQGITSDQVVAAANPMQRSLVYRAQPSWYLSGSSFSNRDFISYRDAGDPVEATVNPRTAFDDLFGTFVPDDEGDAARLEFNLRARRSVLDFVLGKRDTLLAKVSRGDRIRLEAHFDEIRDLEARIAAIPPMTGGACQVPTDPGNSWPIGGDNPDSGAVATGTGYSNEHERSRVLCDLIRMAFVCDLSRSASLQITVFQSHMNVKPVTEMLGLAVTADLHEVGHNGDPDRQGQLAVSTCLKWHLSHYAYLVEQLKNTPEGDGTLLDNSAIVFTPEGGHGRHLDSPDDGEVKTHSVENMVMFVAGKAGGLVPGQHIDGDARHPAQVLVSGMQAAGVETDSLGEVDGNIGELFG